MTDYNWRYDYEPEIAGELREAKPVETLKNSELVFKPVKIDGKVCPYEKFYSEKTVEIALNRIHRFVVRNNSNGLYVYSLNSIDSFQTTKHVENALRLTRREAEMFFQRQEKLGNYFNTIIDLEKEGLL